MNDSTASGLSGWFSNNRVVGGRFLVALGVVFAALAAFLSYKAGAWSRSEGSLPTNIPLLLTSIWALWTGLSVAGCGMWLLAGEPGRDRELLLGRAVLLVLTGLVGAGLFFLGLVLLYAWNDTLTQLLREGDREGAWRILLSIATAIIGLAIMFLGLQSAKAEERRVAGIRQYVYGFNAFLTGFLLLAILVVLNVLAVMRLSATIDSTASGAFTISERTKQVLAELDQPTTIYIVINKLLDEYTDAKGMLSIFVEQTPRLTIESVAPDDRQAIQKLMKKFPRLSDEGEGLLIVMNDDANKSTYIPMNDLVKVEMDPMGRGRGSEQFVGEGKVINELSFLLAGKEKPIVYVTQGNGEPDLTDTRKRDGLGILRERLQRRNFDVRALQLEPINPKVPDDAKVVVIAGPKQPYPPSVADALKAYVDRGGKLIMMADIVEVGRGVKEMPATGLENLLAAYGVEITRDLIFSILFGDTQVVASDSVITAIDPDAARNPIVAPFVNINFEFSSCRAIKPVSGFQNPSIRVQTLLGSVLNSRIRFFTESDMQVDIEQLIRQILKEDGEAIKRLATSPLPVMIAVSESPPPAHSGTAPQPEKPKMVVFGDSTFVANLLAVDRNAIEFDLFIGAVEWLRERPANIGIEPRSYKYYEMDRSVAEPGFAGRLWLMEFLAASLAVFGLGIGVWLVRRQ